MTVEYTEDMTPPERFLVTALKDRKTPDECRTLDRLYESIGDDAAFAAASKNKVLPIVAHALMETVAPIPQRWKDAHEASYRRTVSFFRELEQVAYGLEQRQVRIAVIENGGVAHSVYPCLGCFVSNDLEVLVEKGDVSVVDAYLRSCGYEQDSRQRCLSERKDLTVLDPTGWIIYRKSLSEGMVFWLNLMWRPVIRRWLPLGGQELSTVELLSRSVVVRDSPLRVLSNEDQVLLCALHTASHSYVRGIGLRLQLDVDRLARRLTIDWPVVVKRAEAHEIRHAVFPSLAIPQGLWQTPVPGVVLDRLVPSAARRRLLLETIARASVFDRGRRKFRKLELLRLEAGLCDRGPVLGVLRAVFPPAEWMREGYGFRREAALPVYYARRLANLAFRRSP